jgi:hypothetical protein
MKKQYTMEWYTTDGNYHDLYPVYAESEMEAIEQTRDFIENYQKKKGFYFPDSLKVRK